MNRIFLFIILCLLPLCLNATFRGKVYVDSNRNGQYDKGEKVLKGVMVSDGLNVTKTAVDGTYSLPGHSKVEFLFITTPSGYQTNYKHYYRVTNDREGYDFGVFPLHSAVIASDSSHSFVHISDTEISSKEGQNVWLANVRDYAINEKAAFIIHTGDLCYEAGMKAHLPMMNSENMGVPVFYCIGNHDLVKGKSGEELYESIYGPVYYSFDVGNVHYIVTPMLGGDYRPGYTKEEVYRWLKNDLAQIPAGKPIVVFSHDLLTKDDNFIYGINDREFIDLDNYNLKAWIYGHWHINHIRKHQSAVSICTSTPIRGGIDHAAAAFRVIKVDRKGALTSTLRYTYINKQVQIASIQNGEVSLLKNGNIPLSVNAYHTVSPAREVVYSCWVDGQKIINGRPLHQKTDFNWFGEIVLPDKCKGRQVAVEVEARFTNGEVAETRETFVCPITRITTGKVKGDWNNLLGNSEHIGISKDTLSAPFSLLWTQNVGSNIYMTSPVIYRGKVYIASADENASGKSAIVAMDALTGVVCWKYPVSSSVKNSIAATQGLVFAQDVDGHLYAVDASTGQLIWEKQLDVMGVPALNDGLVVSGDTVFAGSGEGLCAVEASSGREYWKNTSWKQGEGTTATLSSGTGVLVGSVQWDALYGNDIRTGKLLWRVEKEGVRNRASSPAIHGGVMYLLSNSSLFVMSVHTGQILAKKKLPYSVDVTSTPLVTEDAIIFGTARNGMVALDRENLERRWNYMTGDALIYTSPYVCTPASQIESSPVKSGKLVLFGASDGAFYALDCADGNLCWKHSVGAPVMSTVAVSGNMMFGADYAGNVYGFVSKE